MTLRWKPGKKPTKGEVVNVLVNALTRPPNMDEIDRQAKAVMAFYQSRVDGKS